MLSPAGQGEAIDAESWGAMTRPVLIATGSKDSSRKGHSYTWRVRSLSVSRQRKSTCCSWLMVITISAGLVGLVTLGGTSEPAARGLRESATLAFWDARLKDDPDAVRF